MRKLLCALLLHLSITTAWADNIYVSNVKSLQAVVNQDWLAPAVLRLESDDILHIGFDELSHDLHRYIYHLERCEADWTVSEEIFESDWLEGLNNNPIDTYEWSVNTVIPYTHYDLEIPNEQVRLKLSGNYRLNIIDEETGQRIAQVEFMVTEQSMALSMSCTTNTEIDTNNSHQQLSLNLSYNNLPVTFPDDQIKLVVTQNNRQDNKKAHIRPTTIRPDGLSWSHCKELIFDAGNEYRKFEVLDPSHPTMGIDYIRWDGDMYQVYPFLDEPRYHYLYDEDANGSFCIRNSDNQESNTTSEYVWVNYRLRAPELPEGQICIDGRWTTERPDMYLMTFDQATMQYTARVLQKQGYYSYQYLWTGANGTKQLLPTEGNYYQTENCYQAYIYYKGIGDRTWRLTAYGNIQMASSDRSDRRLR